MRKVAMLFMHAKNEHACCVQRVLYLSGCSSQAEYISMPTVQMDTQTVCPEFA